MRIGPSEYIPGTKEIELIPVGLHWISYLPWFVVLLESWGSIVRSTRMDDESVVSLVLWFSGVESGVRGGSGGDPRFLMMTSFGGGGG